MWPIGQAQRRGSLYSSLGFSLATNKNEGNTIMGNGLDIDHNYTILDVLIATPFDKRFNLNGKLDTISFFKYLFIENQSFQEMKESLEEFISNKAQSLPFFCFLEGYAGTGKTTFINWFSRETELEKQFAIIDFSTSKSYTHAKGDTFSGEELFKDYFLTFLASIYEEYINELTDLFGFLYKNRLKLITYFGNNFLGNINKCYVPTRHNHINDSSYVEFIQSLKYTEMILRMLLNY